MVQPESDGTLSPVDSRHTRVQARKACDGCRRRKVRCQYDGSSSPAWQDLDRPAQDPLSNQRKCRRCERMILPCTFLLETKVRGPRKRTNPPLIESTHSQTSSYMRDIHFDAATRQDASSRKLQPHDHLASSRDISISSPNTRPELRFCGPLQQVLASPDPMRNSVPPHEAVSSSPYATDKICDRGLLRFILNDYVEHLYPVIPVVHRPSFRKDLECGRDIHDTPFRGLIIALCAVTVAIMPRKFKEYRSLYTPLQFQTRTEMVIFCHNLLSALREPQYFDEISHLKWAISYLMGIAFFQIGQQNLCRMAEVESMQFARLLELHLISSYSGLNAIEVQLRKKAFWLMFYGYVHYQLQSVRKEKLTFLDSSMIQELDLEALLPSPKNDDLDEERGFNSQGTFPVTLTMGFNIHSRLFWAALTSLTPRQSPKRMNEHCICTRRRQPLLQISHLQNRLQELRYMLDDAPQQLRPWATEDCEDYGGQLDAHELQVVKSQFATMRANTHVTHLWLQNMILDEVHTLLTHPKSQQSSPSSITTSPSTSYDLQAAWTEREDICRQLLHVLHSIPEINLETNGLHLAYKVRDIAVTLLACPFPPESDPAQRAEQYLKDLTSKLSRLDGSEALNTLSLQSWVDTDRRKDSYALEAPWI